MRPQINRWLAFADEAWDDYLFWQENDPRILRRINEIVSKGANMPNEFKNTSPLGKTATVRGYEIKRCKIGQMLAALELISQIPGELANAVMNGIASQDGAEQSLAALTSALTYAPQPMLEIISKLLDIPYDMLLDDPEVGLMGLLEMLGAWAEVNELENFSWAVRAIMGAKDGESMDSSPRDCALESGSASYSRIITLGRLASCLRRGQT